MISKHLLVAIAGVVGLFVIAGVSQPVKENWPIVSFPEATKSAEKKAAGVWIKNKLSYEAYLSSYSAIGDYLNYGQKGICEKNPRRTLDDDGIAMREYGGKLYYHPVLSAQCGLSAYGWFVRGNDGLPSAIRYADQLISMQSEDGAFRYPFPYRYYLTDRELPAGWASGMAQGQAMSLMARIYNATGDQKYLNAGKRAFDYLITPTSKGGVMTTLADLDPSLSRYIFFEEYVSEPANYTLNGYIFALLGLYDWSAVDPEAREYFDKGIKTLVKILPYYDAGTLSAYDLGYMTFQKPAPNINPRYHAVHIYLIHAINSIVDNDVLKDYEAKWTENVAAL